MTIGEMEKQKRLEEEARRQAFLESEDGVYKLAMSKEEFRTFIEENPSLDIENQIAGFTSLEDDL